MTEEKRIEELEATVKAQAKRIATLEKRLVYPDGGAPLEDVVKSNSNILRKLLDDLGKNNDKIQGVVDIADKVKRLLGLDAGTPPHVN